MFIAVVIILNEMYFIDRNKFRLNDMYYYKNRYHWFETAKTNSVKLLI